MDAIFTAVNAEREQCRDDRRFYSVTGAQWEGALGEQHANKPRIELNKVHLSVIRIINEYRNNRVSVAFTPKDGTPNDKFADVCAGLYRADENLSTANEAYDNAFEEGVGGGIGAWRLRACYENEFDEENDQQRIRIEPIFDADSTVFFDLDAKRQDKADAKFCFVITPMTRDAYEDLYGDDVDSWPEQVKQGEFDWATPDTVYVAEYYEVEETSEVIHYFRGLVEGEPDMRVPDSELKDDPGKLDQLKATGFREVRRKRQKRQKVHKYQLSGMKVLEDEGIIAGHCIPIVMYFGKRWVVDGIERAMGHVRLAKDAQRLINVLMSWLSDIATRFDIEKPIVTPEQIRGHANAWANDNIERFPYLLLNPMTDLDGNPMPAGPIGYTKAPNLPPAMAALMQLAEQSLQDLLGNQQAGEQLQPNMSGKAVELIQNRLDMQTFIYMSNLGKATKRSGEIWLSMMRDIAIEDERKMKSLSTDGEPSSVTINRPIVDKDGAQTTENDFSKAAFDVDVDVGPSSSSQRAAVVRALTGLASLTQDPEMLQALTLSTITNIQGEGMQDLRDWARAKAVRMGIIKPTDEEMQQIQAEQAQQKPDPQAAFLEASAGKAQADMGAAQAKAIQTMADAELKKAQTAQIEATLTGTHPDQALAQGDQAIQAAGKMADMHQAAAQHDLASRQAEHAMSQPPSPPKPSQA
jgi:hypothetical protein